MTVPMPGPASVDGLTTGDGRVVLLLTSPRVGPGQLTWSAWDALRTADRVLAADPGPGWAEALAEAEVRLVDLGDVPVDRRARDLVETATGGRSVVWLGSPDGDPGLTDALAEHLGLSAQTADLPEVEVITGSYDVPGSRLLDLVAVMDRLRSPGGCPWDAEQTHLSLLPYLLEEAHEVLEAVDRGDRAHLREELGDLLLQVVFHARVAEEDPDDPFSVDDVAAGIVAKLVHRHPHVFAEVEVDGPAAVEANWERLKAEEKGRRGVFEGIPATLPALARAQKMLSRLERAVGRGDATGEVGAVLDAAVAGDPVAAGLLRVVREAAAGGTDAETALRAALTRLVDAVDPVGAADPDAVDPDAVDLVAETRGAAGRSRPGEGGG